MTQPSSMDEFSELFEKNLRIEGNFDKVRTVLPCPFCAAPDFTTFRILTTSEDMQQEATCDVCGRSARFIVNGDASGIAAELVQTGGEPPPPWMEAPRYIRADGDVTTDVEVTFHYEGD